MADSNTVSTAGGIDGKTLVLSTVDIVQLIGQTVSLKKRGSSYIGLCPFHSEKTPSFHVHPDRNYFYCFGCKASGNAIDFVMKRDRLEFVDAMKQLAEQYNIDLPKFGNSRESAGLRQQLLEAHSQAASYFEQNLWHPSIGKAARDYLKSRGFEELTLKNFRVGLAIDSWDGMLTSPLMKKFDQIMLHTGGLLKSRDNGSGYYDTFRDRIIFPIRDEAGRVIAFGGRVMPGSDNPAKYLNSPESPLFSKSKVAYGLDSGRQRIVETKTVAVVEGYTDVVMAHQFGASNVISVLGTALTEQHVTLLRRFADRIVLLFDGDAAGDLAVDRALQLFLTQPIEIGIATLPDGLDPDEYLIQHGTEAFDNLLKNCEDALSFQWRQLYKQLTCNPNDLTGRAKAVESYLERLAAARSGGPVDPIRWGSILARVSKLTDIPTEQLNRRFQPKRPAPTRFGPNGQRNFQKITSPAAKAPTARNQAERWLLGGLLHLPDEWQRVQQVFDSTEFTVEELQPLAQWYWDYQRHEGQPLITELAVLLDAENLKSLAIELANEVESMNNLHQTLYEAVQFVQKEKQRSEHQKLVSDLRRTTHENRDDSSEIDALRRISEAARLRSGRQDG